MDSTFKLKRIKTFPKEIFLVLSGTFFTSASYFMVWPYLSLILYKNFNLSATKIGLILTSSAVVASIIGLISGYFSDKIGRKKIILCGSFLNALGFLLMSQAKNLELYKVSIFLCSIGTSLFGTTGKSIISDTINEGKNREFAFYIRYFLINAGAAFGPMIGVFFGISLKQITFQITSLIYGLYFILFTYVLKNKISLLKKHEKIQIKFIPTFKEIASNSIFMLLLFSNIIMAFVYASTDSSLVQYLARSSVPNLTTLIGTIVATNSITIVVFQFPILKLIEHYRTKTRIKIGILLVTVSQAISAFNAPNLILGWIIATFILSLGELIAFPTFSIELDRNTPAHLKGSYFGVSELTRIGFALAPVIGGVFLDHTTGRNLYLFMTGLCLFVFSLQTKKTVTSPS